MNSLLQNEFPLREAQNMRYDLLNMLTDADLNYKLPGDNPTLGELCREMGSTEQVYIESFKTLKTDWSHPNTDPELATSLDRLRAWYTALDDEFEDVIRGYSEDDLHTKHIDRGGFAPPAHVQFQIFHEALLMFYAKASVYLKALQKPLSEDWRIGVG